MMLPMIGQDHSPSTDNRLFTPGRSQWKDAPANNTVRETGFDASPRRIASSSEEMPEETEMPLEDAARAEREYVRQRLREELQRNPTEEEVDEWLRQHTEGY